MNAKIGSVLVPFPGGSADVPRGFEPLSASLQQTTSPLEAEILISGLWPNEPIAGGYGAMPEQWADVKLTAHAYSEGDKVPEPSGQFLNAITFKGQQFVVFAELRPKGAD